MRNALPIRVQLGAFELDLKAGELRKARRKVRLQEQPFQILRMLVERPGELVTTEEIQKKLWPNDTVVEFDHSIHTAMKKVRQALGDSAANPRYIETVARRGYRLMMPLERVDSSSGDVPAVEAASSGQDETNAQIQLESAPLIGQTVSHYRVLHVIGGGGMGVVYKAEDLKLGRTVALKFLPEAVGSDPRALERFQREARTASSLNHPNICTIYEIEEHEGQPFIVMELLEGRTLRDRLAATSSAADPRTINQIFSIALQISEGLEAAHEKGIIHRDIKPANIFITNKGVAKILDFGLAKLLQPSGEPAIAAEAEGELGTPTPVVARQETSHLTRLSLAVGTAAYMSPEQVRGEKLDARTDLFSFGVILYEMVTGRQPFTGDAAATLHDAILNHAPPLPKDLNPELPTELQDVIQKSLEKDRNLRYQSAAEIGSDLERIKRETQQPSLRHWKVLATTAVVAVALIAGGLYRRSGRVTKLGEKDTIVLGDFTNTTGDPVFDDTLRQGMSAQLEQSPFLRLLSDSRIAQTLSLMSQPKNAPLTPELTREVCQRTASAAVLHGSIAQVGTRYLLTLNALNCQNGELLASTEAQAGDKNHVLDALGKAASEIRGKLGESLASVQKYDMPPENVTTTSLEALQAYSLAAPGRRHDLPPAIPLLQRAINLDPNFAMAYAELGVVYFDLNETARAAENLGRAYALRDRVSEYEKFYIASHYHEAVTGNLEAGRQDSELWAQIYPHEPAAPAYLGVIYCFLGHWDQVLIMTEKKVELSHLTAPESNLVESYIFLNRLDQAKTLAQEGTRVLDSPLFHFSLYTIGFLQRDVASMDREAADAMGKPGWEDLMLYRESDTAAFGGQFFKARELTRRAVESAQRVDKKETAAVYTAEAAVRESLVGNMAFAKQQAKAALRLSSGKQVAAMSAIALGRAGESARAISLANDLDKRYPEDTIVQSNFLPTIRAAAALHGSDDAGKAIQVLEAATPYELGFTSLSVTFALYPVYLRGEAYLAAKQGTAAATEFQKISDHPGVVQNEPIGALAYLGLGRAYVLQRDTSKAKAAYQNFLTLWKDADPDIPIYRQAEAEYAKLGRVSSVAP